MSDEHEREYRRRDDLRREQERAEQRRQDRRDEDRRRDRRDEERRRAEEVADAWRDLRRGDTAWALRGLAGPDAAIAYLRGTAGAPDPDPPAPGPEPLDWPHPLVDTVAELVANVAALPAGVRLEPGRPDRDGDVPVRAYAPEPFAGTAVGSLWTSLRGGIPVHRDLGRFWVRRRLLADLAAARGDLDRARDLLDELG